MKRSVLPTLAPSVRLTSVPARLLTSVPGRLLTSVPARLLALVPASLLALVPASLIAASAASAHAATAPALAPALSSGSQAATAPAPSPADLTAARQAVTASLGTVGSFFASQNGRVRVTTQAEAARTAPRVTGQTVGVYDLNPAFVRGTSTTVAVLSFLATPTSSSTGQTASVWTVKYRTGWKVVNIASGTDEETYAAQAGGGTVFHEPQINAWYALRAGRVLPLNTEARQSVQSGVTLAAYQRLVQHRYGDKLPGSAYARRGLAGGYGVLGPSSHHTGHSTPVLPILAGALTIGAAATLGTRALIRTRH